MLGQVTEETAQALVRTLDATVLRLGELAPKDGRVFVSDARNNQVEVVQPLGGLSDKLGALELGLAAVASYLKAARDLGSRLDKVTFALRSAVEANDRLTRRVIPRLPAALANVTPALERLTELGDQLNTAASEAASLDGPLWNAAAQVRRALHKSAAAMRSGQVLRGFPGAALGSAGFSVRSSMRDIYVDAMPVCVRGILASRAAIDYVFHAFRAAGWDVPPGWEAYPQWMKSWINAIR